MLCQVEADHTHYQKSLEDSDSAYNHWKWCFEGELKFLNKYAKGGAVKLSDMDEVKECIDTLFEETRSFSFKGSDYDLSEDLKDFLNNL